METSLQLQKISKIFNQDQWNEVVAVNHVSAEFCWGECVLIIGDNGSGKSTLLNLIDGTVRLTKGWVNADGMDISEWPSYKRSSLIYRMHQSAMDGVAPYGTVAENMALSKLEGTNRKGLFSKLVSKEDRRRYKVLLENLKPELSDRLDHKAYLLSPGQRQALGLAMLMLRDDRRRILLADEPTAALDPETSQKFLDLIYRKAKEGWLCFIITHDTDIIRSHQGRVLRIEKGEIGRDEIV
jgi:putative ABC transport system ATP-binding protein